MKLDVARPHLHPVSALHGDNVVERSANMPWYEGSSLLHHLEEVHIATDRNLIDARFPVQYVIRPQDQIDHDLHDYRGYAGTVAGGVFKPGDEVVVLPSGLTTTIAAIDTADGPVDEAFAPMAVTDPAGRRRRRVAGRHDLPGSATGPTCGQDIEAMVCWLTERVVAAARRQAGHQAHDPRGAARVVKDLQYRLDVNTLHRDEAATALALNEIGRVQLRTTVPLFFDEYRRNRTTGSFILVDEATNNTVGAGMILGPTEVA